MLQQAFDDGEYETVLRLHAFNVRWPTKRHWHHQVHSDFDLPCDELCSPAPKRKGGSDLIQRIKQAYRIEDIAEKHTRLRGNSVLKGKCFLHGEQHGEAFTVWVDDQKWKCFGACGIGGDVLDLVRAMKERGIEWH